MAVSAVLLRQKRIFEEKTMNKQAVYHAIKSNYSFPISDHELEVRLRVAKGEAQSVELIHSMKYDWTIRRESCAMHKAYSDDLFDYFIVRLRLQDTRFAYIFRIVSEGRSYYFSENGVTEEYDFSLGYFNFFQCPYINPADVHREVSWVREAIVYQIFVERFFVGETGKKKEYVNLRWGDIPNPKSFAGGDLEGIRLKLDYLQDLGVNTLYLTPIFESCSNHKYDIRNYFRVDGMFGGNEAFARLSEEAHARGMRIILDAVFNHCSAQNKIFADVEKKGRKSRYYDWFFIEGDKPDQKAGNYEHFAGCKYMPKLNTNTPAVQDYLISVGKYWVEKYGIDGWRLDVADEVSDVFWRRFRRELKREHPDVLLIAENWHDAYPWLRGDEYDGVMNYSLTKACLDYLVYGVFDAQAMSDRLSHILMRNTDQVNNMMLNLLDSHDTERFLTLAKKSGKDERSLLCALAILFFSPGMPCIYYGTEIGMEGGYDPDCRRTFDWDRQNWNMQIYETVKKLIRLRKDIAGEVTYSAKDGVLLIGREGLLLAVNNGEETRTLNMAGRKYAIDPVGFKIIDIKEGGVL